MSQGIKLISLGPNIALSATGGKITCYAEVCFRTSRNLMLNIVNKLPDNHFEIKFSY